MGINIIDNITSVTLSSSQSSVNPTYTTVEKTIYLGNVTSLNFGSPNGGKFTGGSGLGIILPSVLGDNTIKLIENGVITNNTAVFPTSISGNIFNISNVTGITTSTTSKNFYLTPGYTIMFKDIYGNLNSGGPVLLPNDMDIISGSTIYVNGLDIMDQRFKPFKVINGTYLLTYVSGDYTNKKFFFSLTGDVIPSIDRDVIEIDQEVFASLEPTSVYYNNKNIDLINYILPIQQSYGTINYIVDIILQDSKQIDYYQRGVLYTTLWSDISEYSIGDYYILYLPREQIEKGLKFKIIVKQFVSTLNSRLLIASTDIRIISPHRKTYDNILQMWLIEINTAETIELYYDGYDYIVTNHNSQMYSQVSNYALSINDPNMSQNNYIQNNINDLIG